VAGIVYHPKVPSEAREFLGYYEGVSRELGDKFWTELSLAIAKAGKHPKRHHFDQLGAGLRRSNLKSFPVHFLFRVFPYHVRITTVRHDRCRPSDGIRRR
jgi:hypothetical protein